MRVKSFNNMNEEDNDQNHNLDEIEEKLIRKDEEKRKLQMPVVGRSVFEIKRIKNTKKK